jgi:hypothetical protein
MPMLRHCYILKENKMKNLLKSLIVIILLLSLIGPAQAEKTPFPPNSIEWLKRVLIGAYAEFPYPNRARELSKDNFDLTDIYITNRFNKVINNEEFLFIEIEYNFKGANWGVPFTVHSSNMVNNNQLSQFRLIQRGEKMYMYRGWR